MTFNHQRIISADSHVVEPPNLWEHLLTKRFGERTPRVLDSYLGREGPFFFDGTMVVNAHSIINMMEAQKDVLGGVGNLPEDRVTFQKAADLEAEILNATFMSHVMYASNDPKNREMVRSAASIFNDWIAEYASHNPKRLVVNAEVPTDDIDFAVEELTRSKKKGLRGAIIHTAPPLGCPPYRSACYDRLWAAAQDLEMPITLHIVTGNVPDAIHFQKPEEIQEAPGYWMALFQEIEGILANDFIFGGILDRFPMMDLVCAEYEINWIPNFIWRLNQLQNSFGSFVSLPKISLEPKEYMTNRIWHGLVDDPFALESIPHIGAHKIMWGSDFPHPRSIGLNAREHLTKSLKPLKPSDQKAIAGENAATLYNI